jgi:hypothetical protein
LCNSRIASGVSPPSSARFSDWPVFLGRGFAAFFRFFSAFLGIQKCSLYLSSAITFNRV